MWRITVNQSRGFGLVPSGGKAALSDTVGQKGEEGGAGPFGGRGHHTVALTLRIVGLGLS